MADKLKTGKTSSFGDRMPGIKKAFAEVNKHKEKAAEAIGQAGKATKTAVDDLNVNRWAFTATAQLLKKDPTEQQARCLQFFALCIEMGVLDQVDAFDEHLGVIAQRVAELSDGDTAKAPKASSVVTSIATGAAGAPAH